MTAKQTKYSVVDLLCFLPNEWKDHPEAVTKLILVEEIRDHLRNQETMEGLVIDIADVTAESKNHINCVWFRKIDDQEIEPDLIKYYPIKIHFCYAVKISYL